MDLLCRNQFVETLTKLSCQQRLSNCGISANSLHKHSVELIEGIVYPLFGTSKLIHLHKFSVLRFASRVGTVYFVLTIPNFFNVNLCSFEIIL